MDRINFVRNFRNGHGWEQAEITEDESNKIQQQLRELNNRIFAECLKDAHEAMKQFIAPYSNPLPQIQQSAEKLFEKRAIHSLTAYQEFLKAKVEKLRNGHNNIETEGDEA